MIPPPMQSSRTAIQRGQLVGDLERPKNRGAVLVLGEVLIDRAVVDEDVALSLSHANSRNGRLATARGDVKRPGCLRGWLLLEAMIKVTLC